MTLISSFLQSRPMISVNIRDGESGEKFLKRFSSHVKKTKMMQKFRKLRYFIQTPRKNEVRAAAVMREFHRKGNKKRRILS